MKTSVCALLVFWLVAQFLTGSPVQGNAMLSCGQVITEDTLLTEDLYCPPGTQNAITIDAPNVTLDMGGHTLSGHADSNGILVVQAGVTIQNGTLEGFNTGVFVYYSPNVTVKDMMVKNLDISDPDHFIVGVQIEGSQNVVVQDSQFEFLSVAHKEAVQVYRSNVLVNNIEVRGGGAGVTFSFAGVCDPVNAPNTGLVTNSRFSDIYVAGFYIACGNDIRIEGNDISTCPGEGMGMEVEAPHPGAVINLNFTENYVHHAMIGIELRGSLTANVHHNYIHHNSAYGVWVRHSLGCIAPAQGWECFDSTANIIADNETWSNGTDLYHEAGSTGNTWDGNTCETKEGAEIPACLPPNAVLSINYASGAAGSYFSLEGANFPISSTVPITVNSVLLGSVPTDAAGDLAFLIATDQADEGYYVVSAAADTSAPSARFLLDPRRALRLQEGSGTIFNLLAGIGTMDVVYLPFVGK